MTQTTILDDVLLFMPDGITTRGAIAWAGEGLLAVGDGAMVRDRAGSGARRINLPGALVLPGLTDCHTHMLPSAIELSQVRLRSARSRREFVDRVAAWISRNPSAPWILGGQWDDALWGNEPPTRDWVDPVAPERPLLLYRYDMHSALVNSAALRVAGISRETPDPPGGRIVRHERTGEPTGWLVEKAMDLVSSRIPPMSDPEKIRLLRHAFHEAQRLGLTAVHDLVWRFDHRGLHRAALEADPCGLTVFLRSPIEELSRFLEGRREGGGGRLVLHGVKGFTDGSLGSRSAWLREPYRGSLTDTGVSWVEDQDAFAAMVRDAAAHEVPVSIHAIGDAAIGYTLGVFHDCIRRGVGSAYLRIEHFQHPSAEDILAVDHPRLVVSGQPLHLSFDAPAAEERLGPERAALSFPFRTLLGLNCNLVFGSDWLVSDLNPLLGIHAAVTRKDSQGRWPQGWVPEERISVAEAVRCYTANAAKAVGWGGRAGELRAGLRADLTVLDRDITAVSPDRIPDARVLMTVAGGAVVHDGR
jgi:hypothetical protein